MKNIYHLYGACACERNQYTIIIPTSSASLAQVFFDNSAANRRSQAVPLTAWLRIPLDWYHSSTVAQFPDESHTTIRRTFNTPSHHPTLPPTRRQFCGYCGTHLTAWSEGNNDSADHITVTLGSLLSESIDQLETLNIIPDTADDEENFVQGAEVNQEDNIPTKEPERRGVDEPLDAAPDPAQVMSRAARHSMSNRGMPYFEEMVENSRLGRIKRQKGGHTSENGRTVVQWEVVEIDGDGTTPMDTEPDVEGVESRSKRQKLSE